MVRSRHSATPPHQPHLHSSHAATSATVSHRHSELDTVGESVFSIKEGPLDGRAFSDFYQTVPGVLASDRPQSTRGSAGLLRPLPPPRPFQDDEMRTKEITQEREKGKKKGVRIMGVRR